MSDITLKPCPYCQSDNVCISISPEMQDGRRFYYGFCYDCTMTTPEVSNEEGEGIAEEQAAAAWNALPRRLRWTTEPPTEPGWYWCKRLPIGSLEICIVFLGADYLDEELLPHKEELDTLFVLKIGGNAAMPLEGYTENAQWAGPIPEPQEE